MQARHPPTAPWLTTAPVTATGVATVAAVTASAATVSAAAVATVTAAAITAATVAAAAAAIVAAATVTAATVTAATVAAAIVAAVAATVTTAATVAQGQPPGLTATAIAKFTTTFEPLVPASRRTRFPPTPRSSAFVADRPPTRVAPSTLTPRKAPCQAAAAAATPHPPSATHPPAPPATAQQPMQRVAAAAVVRRSPVQPHAPSEAVAPWQAAAATPLPPAVLFFHRRRPLPAPGHGLHVGRGTLVLHRGSARGAGLLRHPRVVSLPGAPVRSRPQHASRRVLDWRPLGPPLPVRVHQRRNVAGADVRQPAAVRVPHPPPRPRRVSSPGPRTQGEGQGGHQPQ